MDDDQAFDYENCGVGREEESAGHVHDERIETEIVQADLSDSEQED